MSCAEVDNGSIVDVLNDEKSDDDIIDIQPTLNEELDEFIFKLKQNNVSLVCFDMDGTITGLHSHGILLKIKLGKYAERVSEAFKIAVPRLLKEGIKIGIVSFTDIKYYSIKKPQKLILREKIL